MIGCLYQFEAVNASATIAQNLNIEPGKAILIIKRYGYDIDNHVIEYSASNLVGCSLFLQLTASQTNQDDEWWCTLKS